MLDGIHDNPLVAMLSIMLGIILGVALAVSDWKSKFTIGSLLATLMSFFTSLTAEKVSTLKRFLEESALLTPMLYSLNIALAMFCVSLFAGSNVVFWFNFVKAKRRSDPEAFVKAVRRATTVFGSGLYKYVTAPPELVTVNEIRQLERHADVLNLLQRTLVYEIGGPIHSIQHFKDSVQAAGRLLLQYAFNESADLQHFRMAFFERRGDRLEYVVSINNQDWTAHSLKGFDVKSSFVGHAVALDRPLIYPRDKKIRTPFEKRKGARYKSFIALPVPCGRNATPNIGAITLDYTGKASVFTTRRIDALFSFAQFIHAMYVINIKGGHYAKAIEKQHDGKRTVGARTRPQ